MARTSQTDLAVLGALSIAPMTGYAVRAAIAETLGHFWSESFGQIYPALHRLRDDGLVRGRADGSRTVYELTPAGRARLVELLSVPVEAPPARNPLLLRIFLGAELGPTRCRELVEESRVRAADRLDELVRIRAEVEAEEPSAHRPYRLLTIAAGEAAQRAHLAWADATLTELRRLEAAAGDSAGAPAVGDPAYDH